VTGLPIGGGRREPVPSLQWNDIHIELSTKEQFTRGRHGFGVVARLTSFGDGWYDLAIEESEIEKLKPASINSAVLTYHSGAAGKPSSMHIVEAERDRRIAEGQVWKSKVACAEEMARWLKSAHPQAARATAKAIENSLRSKMPTTQYKNIGLISG
jgi:hypothetical protein